MTKRKIPKDILTITSLSAEWMFRNLVFVAFLALLGIFYIANAHFAEKKVRRIQALQKEVKELRWSYMSLTSENMYNSKYSEVAKKVRSRDLELRKPNIITVPDQH